MITCKELADFIAAFLDGELKPEQLRDFEEHLAVCPPCVAYLETYRETVRLGKSAFTDPDAPVPEEVPDELIEAILSARRH